MAKKPKLGSGARFKKLVASIKSKSGAKKKSGKGKRKVVSNPAAVAASIGRKKYGAKRFAKLSAGGRKRSKSKK